jgi:hypothetical protein
MPALAGVVSAELNTRSMNKRFYMQKGGCWWDKTVDKLSFLSYFTRHTFL